MVKERKFRWINERTYKFVTRWKSAKNCACREKKNGRNSGGRPIRSRHFTGRPFTGKKIGGKKWLSFCARSNLVNINSRELEIHVEAHMCWPVNPAKVTPGGEHRCHPFRVVYHPLEGSVCLSPRTPFINIPGAVHITGCRKKRWYSHRYKYWKRAIYMVVNESENDSHPFNGCT